MPRRSTYDQPQQPFDRTSSTMHQDNPCPDPLTNKTPFAFVDTCLGRYARTLSLVVVFRALHNQLARSSRDAEGGAGEHLPSILATALRWDCFSGSPKFGYFARIVLRSKFAPLFIELPIFRFRVLFSRGVCDRAAMHQNWAT